jgi:serine phosphatase RsbU (regulator of sigma subunit)/CHASE3 domain sensor protein
VRDSARFGVAAPPPTIRPMLLRRRLLLVFVGMVIGLLALAVVARVVVRGRDDAAVRARNYDLASERVARLEAALVNQESGERGFVLTGDESFLEPYRAGRTDANRTIASLRALTTTVAALDAKLDATVAAYRRWHAEAAVPEIALRKAGDIDGSIAAVESGIGKRRFDAVRTELTRVAAAIERGAQAADAKRQDYRRALTVVISGIVVLALLATVVVAWLIRRWVSRPLDALVDDVHRVQVGELDAPIRSTGPPEIAELGAAIEDMRSRLSESRILAERAHEAIEQNAGVVLALRSQLEPDVGELPEGWTVAAQLRAAEGVAAGDCYDLAAMPGGRLALVVVDIAGHGATEGILALRCKELLRASLAASIEPGDAIRTAAQQLGNMGPEVFLTVFVAVLDMADGSIRYANAGHPPAFVSAEDGDHELGPTGPLVGLLGQEWESRSASMEVGDNLCAYTDGLIEVRNASREFFGPKRLAQLVRGSRCDEAGAVVQRVLDEVELFAPGRLHDDATIVVLCRAG